MSLEEELYEERRRKWRRSGFWRGVGFVILFFALAIGLAVFLRPEAQTGPHIARHEVFGVIFNDPARDALIAEMAEDADVAALIVYIESPGGTTVGSEALFEAIRTVAAEKPVVAVMGEIAASGGYIAGIAADHIVARGNTLTGSIGVIMEYPNFSDLLTDLGVEVETIRSSDVKGGASPFRDTNPVERAQQVALIDDSYAWFRDLVADRRDLAGPALDRVADGRVFTGRQALDVGLIDGLGAEDEALDWLESQDSALEGLPVRLREVEEDEDGFLDMVDDFLGASDFLPALTSGTGPRLWSIAQ